MQSVFLQDLPLQFFILCGNSWIIIWKQQKEVKKEVCYICKTNGIRRLRSAKSLYRGLQCEHPTDFLLSCHIERERIFFWAEYYYGCNNQYIQWNLSETSEIPDKTFLDDYFVGAGGFSVILVSLIKLQVHFCIEFLWAIYCHFVPVWNNTVLVTC